MINLKKYINDIIAGALLVASVILVCFALTINNRPGDSDKIAERTSQIISHRLEILDGFIDQALDEDPAQWMELKDLPEDMVVYKYVDDTLQSWSNQFTVANDDINNKLIFQRISNLRDRIVSPLSEVTDKISYVNYGPKWYLVKAVTEHNTKIIAGLEIMNTLVSTPLNGINPRLHLDPTYTIQPLTDSDGSAITIDGQPLMKVLSDANTREAVVTNTTAIWISMLLFVCGIIIFLNEKRSLRRFCKVVIGLTIVILVIYFWGMTLQGNSPLFSPTLYADGGFLYSLGALLIWNTYVTLLIFFTYLVREDILKHLMRSSNYKRNAAIFLAGHSLAILLDISYVCLTIRSIILNSSISLELCKLSTLTPASIIVFISYILIMVMTILMVQMLRPYVHMFFGFKINVFSKIGIVIASAAIALFLVLTTGIIGFKKEENRVNVWANRLSIDRDISLEIQLRAKEYAIANDALIASLSEIPNSNNIILNRISENYLFRIAQDYDLSVYLFNDNEQDPAVIQFFNDRVRNGQPVSETSRFTYSYNANGHIRYTGMFVYAHQNAGVTRMLVGIEPKSDREDRGYSSILGFNSPGKVVISPYYSYAKYIDSRLVTFKGTYPYPTILSSKLKGQIAGNSNGHITIDKNIHFMNQTSDNELIVISRQKIEGYKYLTEIFFIALVSFFLLTLLKFTRKRKVIFEKNYYKSRINTVLMLSLVMTLIAMATISVIFVYDRNNANLEALMTNKINAIQAIVESRCQNANTFGDLGGQEMAGALEDVGNATKIDVTLYTTEGVAFISTMPEIFDKMILGPRLNEQAYNNIIYKNKRYFINKERIGPHKFYSLSAPLFNANGKMIAILSSPYTDDSYDFKTASAFNIGIVITVFVLLLILARQMTTAVVDKMFKPLIEMGKKMNAADLDNLEYIIYERDDEISSLVRAYNLMVHDLSESTRKLTQAERDKAWSEMARQVAHEIKNPLTPMKLQIQRLIRLKQRNVPDWQDRFDEASKIILEHIDILSDTANEFSTFAKLYSEPPIAINLDELLKEEVMMFDNKEQITFSYMGLEDTIVMGPKPQLTRVFVNLITNAIQAIDIQQKEDEENGLAITQGNIIISLRNSTKDNYYDIVIEDNGPGVKEENRNKLFTPNFTTKSSGTGLGLAICRNILEKCKGEIQYSKSFVLGGACFTVRYPKYNNMA